MTDPNTGAPSSGGSLRSSLRQQGSLGKSGFRNSISKWVAGIGLTAIAASAATFVPGYLTYEYYPGKVRDDVESGNAGTPSTAGSVQGADKSGYVPAFESGTNFADNYANRFLGYFVPPTTGDYVFFVAADDDADLFLSTDATPANKKLIAQEAGWSGVRWYNKIGGTSTVDDKRSDKFAGTQWPNSTIHLTQGQKYYIEGVHHEGGGGDNFAVTYKLATEPDPADGSAPRLAGAVIGTDAATAPTAPNFSIVTQPIGGTFYVGGALNLAVGVQSDSSFPVAYQWRRNGTNIAGATGATYDVGTPSAADNGSYDVQVSVPGANGTPVVLTSTAATVTVATPQTAIEPGKLKYEYFPGSDRATVEAGGGSPSTTGTTVGGDNSGFITTFETAVSFADNYANRISGFFIPPVTGDYVFYVASDDDSDLFLSTDDTPANKKLIAQEVAWSNNRQWNTPGGGSSTMEAKRSDLFPDTQWPNATIRLTQGQKYYIEGVHHEGGGGDDFGATYRLATEDEALTADGTASRLTGSVIGVLLPHIISVASANPGARSLSFSIADVAPSLLDPASVKLTFDGKLVTATGSAKDTNGVTRFTYNYPAMLAQGSSHIYTIQASDTGGQPITKTATFIVPFQYFPPTDLKAPAAAGTNWASRFIFNAGTIGDVPTALRVIQSVGTPEFTGTVVDVVTNVINWAGTGTSGHFGNNNGYPDAATTDPNWTGDNFVNLNVGHLNITEEGDYTFAVHSDDGFALRIRGGQAVSVSGAGQIDPVDSEVALESAPTGDSDTRVVYHLKKGVYLIEFFFYENGGGDSGEIYAAKGAFKNDADTATWRLIGDSTPSQELTLLGVDASGWTVVSSDPGGDPLNTLADAAADLAATGGGAKTYDYLNVGDPDTNAGVLAFPKDRPGTDDDDYALKATANLVVPQDGTYVIGFNSDDGGYMKIAGHNFIEIQQNNTGTSVLNGDTVTCDCLTGDSGTTATITLTKGTYPIEVGSFERGGGSFLAARGALAPALAVTTGDIPYLAKNGAGTKVNTPAALQLTSAAVDGGGNGGGTGGPTATITLSGNSVTVSSSNGGTVEATDALGSGTWQTLGAAPQTVPTTGKARFFRIKK